MNLTGFETLLRRYGFDEEDPLLEWVNAGLNDIKNHAEWPFLQNIQPDIAISLGATQLPSLPSDFAKPVNVTDVTDDGPNSTGGVYDLEYYDHREWERSIKNTATPGLPEIYTILDGTLLIWPAPSTARVFDLTYMQDPPDLEDPGDVPTWLPSRWHYSPCVYQMASIALMAENEEERAQTAMGQAGTGLEKMMNFYQLDQLGYPPAVTDAQGYFDDSSG